MTEAPKFRQFVASTAAPPIAFRLNRDAVQTGLPPGALLLDFIRNERRLTGCKPACREGDCGACMVLLGKRYAGQIVYRPAPACLLPLGAVAGAHAVSIEGLNAETLNPIQQALVDNGAIQCGYCTPGIVIALTAFFLNAAASFYSEALHAAAGNLCRCTGYAGIKRAIAQLCERFDVSRSPPQHRLQDLVRWRILPEYFLSVPESLAALPEAAVSAGGADAVLIAGGTDLCVQHPEDLPAQTLQFLDQPPPDSAVRRNGATCSIAAAAAIETLRTAQALQHVFPALSEDLKYVCSAAVRQRASIGGNLANASPIGDLAVLFLALDAQLEIVAGAERRSLPLRHFFRAYKRTDLRPGERLEAIVFGCPDGLLYSFEKVAKRPYLDIASVNSALSLTYSDGVISGAHLAAGGIAPIPLYFSAASGYLAGRPLQAATVREAAKIAQSECTPISDSRGSADYKRLLLRQLIYAHFLKLFPRAILWEDLHAPH